MAPQSNEQLRVLFVDDEQSLLDGLRRSLRPMRHEWQMEFANSGAGALEMLAAASFDVVVSDMRMPNIDGLQLLTAVRDRYPDVARIVLSGQTEMQTALQSVSIAQAFLHKPCDPEGIKDAISRVLVLNGELGSASVRHLIGSIDALPSHPAVIQRLNEYLTAPEVDVDKVVTVVESDVATMAKVLQVANSSFFGVPRTIASVREAITLLGTTTVRDLAVMAKLVESAKDSVAASALEAHSRAIAEAAVAVCDDPTMRAAVWSAAMLHDVGELVMAQGLPEQYKEIQARVANGEDRLAVERAMLGVTHATIGAYLLKLWGLPSDIVEAVAWHHQIPMHLPPVMAPAHAVYVAETLTSGGELPEWYTERLGVTATSVAV